MNDLGKCKVEVCDRPAGRIKTGLCKSHHRRWKQGLPLDSRIGGLPPHNKKYFEGDKCMGPECDRQAEANGKCFTHDWQFRKRGAMWVIGTYKQVREDIEYKTCPVCRETKHWKKFVQGMEKPTGECHECYRARILAVPEETPNNYSLEQLLNDIDRLKDKAKRKAGRKK